MVKSIGSIFFFNSIFGKRILFLSQKIGYGKNVGKFSQKMELWYDVFVKQYWIFVEKEW